MSFDNHITPDPERLRELGIQNPEQAKKNLDLLQPLMGPDGFPVILRSLLPLLSSVADPDMALNNLERFVRALKDKPLLAGLCRTKQDIFHALVMIFGASRFLSTFLITTAESTLTLFIDPDYLSHPVDKIKLSRRLDVLTEIDADEGVFYKKLRLFRKQEMLRIGLRDLLGKADLQEVVAELSDLAEVCLQKAYEWVGAALQKRYGRPSSANPDGTTSPAGFAVIAMGKLGGRELNFSSDVDLMYVYTSDGETEGIKQPDGTVTNRITNHQYFIKLAEKLSSAIGERTEDGFVFRVDLRLRPEGQRGPLAQSLGGYELYYESWGQTWERSALLKARPVAGDEAVGMEFMERISPFVYRKYLDYSAITEIRDMKQKINKDVELKGRTHRDVKLGYGGIREIEFVIQALQLIYAGRDRTLREKNALKALHTLSQKGLITYQEHAELSKAYVFLRTVEHRIQILDDLQTQTLPAEPGELRTLARRTGFLSQGKEAELLLREYAGHTNAVRSIYDELFAFTGEEEGLSAGGDDFERLLDPETTEQEASVLLSKYHFHDPGKAYRNLLLLREGSAFIHQTPRGRKLFHDIFPPLFREIVASHDPDMALHHLESFLAVQGSWEGFQSLVKLDVSAIKILIAIFANSEYLSRMLVSRPVYLQNLLETSRTSGLGTYELFAKELNDALDKAGDIPSKLDVLRMFKHQEEIRIGMTDLLSNLPLRAVSRDLSKLAEVCLDAALKVAGKETAGRYDIPPTVRGLSIIGAGKLGGRELIYGSDLDILFVFSEGRAAAPPSGMTVSEYFSKIAEKTIAYLSTLTREGFVFRVDTRLRPTGSKGPLVQSIDAFKSYYSSSKAETWERQALLRTRFVAGDRNVGMDFINVLPDLLYETKDKSALAHDILSMRKRMEEEIGKESAASYNIKQGTGGLVDIEFIVQYLQLLHGKQHPWVRVPGTYDALRALWKEKLLAADDYRILRRAYDFIRQLESRLRIVSNQATNTLSKDPNKLRFLARRMGYTDDGSLAGQKLLKDYSVLNQEVHLLFEKLLHQT